MKISKIMSVVSALTLSLALTSCGGDKANDNKDDTYCLKVWNVEKEKWESYDGQTELLVLDAGYQMDNMSIGAEKNLLATYTRDGMIHVFDLEK